MLLLLEFIGALVLIGVCAYGASKLIQSWYDRDPNTKDPE